MATLKEQLIEGLIEKYRGEIAAAKANVAVYLENPAGIGEHSNIIEAIEIELDQISKYHDQKEVLQKYFS